MNKKEVVAVLDAIMRDPQWVNTHYTEIGDAKDYISSLIRTENNRTAGAKDVATVAMAIINDAKRHMANSMCHGAKEIDGITYCCNGSVLMSIDRPIDLPMAENCTLDYGKCYMQPIKENGVLGNDLIVEFPSYAELKAETDKLKASAKMDGYKKTRTRDFVYTFDNGLMLNTTYMMWAVKATGSTTAHINGNIKQGIVLSGNGCTFLLLAIRDSSPAVQAPGFHFRPC